MNECVFCKIVAGELSSFRVWEDEKHLAFLSNQPNTEGFTVVITKEHYSSYVVDLPKAVRDDLMDATMTVCALIDRKFEDVGRTGVIFKGFGVDHIHAKLFPMHGTADMKEWRPFKSKVDKYFDGYEGYISSHCGQLANDEELTRVAEKLRN